MTRQTPIERYLDRIEYAGPPIDEPSERTLSALHESHLRTVPFENLDVIGGRPIELGPEAAFEKVVERRRGGFCYELNGLFEWLLSELGFETTLVSCRMRRNDGGFGPAFDHVAVLVHLDDWVLADVGAGIFARSPLPMNGTVRTGVEGSFRVVHRAGNEYVVETDDGDGWETKYRFTTEDRTLDEFAETCAYHQSSPESGFTKRFTCTRATPTGRITLSASSLTTTTNGRKRKRSVSAPGDRRQIVAERFGMPPEHVPERSFEFQPPEGDD